MSKRLRLALLTSGACALIVVGITTVRRARYEAWLGPGPGGPCAPLGPDPYPMLTGPGITRPVSGPLTPCVVGIQLDRSRYLPEEPLLLDAMLANVQGEGATGPVPATPGGRAQVASGPVWTRPWDPDMWRYDVLDGGGRRTWSRRPGPHPEPQKRSEYYQIGRGWSTGDLSFVDPGGRYVVHPDLTYTEIPPWAEAQAPGARYCSPIARPGDYTLRVVYGGVPDSKATAAIPPVDPPEAVVSKPVPFHVLTQDEMSGEDRAAYQLLQGLRQPDGRIWGTTPEQERGYRKIMRDCPKTWYRPAVMYWLARCVAERDPRKGVEELLACFRAYPRLHTSWEGLGQAYDLVQEGDAPVSPRARRIAERTLYELSRDKTPGGRWQVSRGLLQRLVEGARSGG